MSRAIEGDAKPVADEQQLPLAIARYPCTFLNSGDDPPLGETR
jgi:hypothetical protein